MGPGIVPLKPQTSISTWGSSSALHGHRDQVELLGPVAERPGQLVQVGGDDRDGGQAGLPQAGHELAPVGGAAHRPAGAGTLPRILRVSDPADRGGSLAVVDRPAPAAIDAAAIAGAAPRKSRRVLALSMIDPLFDIERNEDGGHFDRERLASNHPIGLSLQHPGILIRRRPCGRPIDRRARKYSGSRVAGGLGVDLRLACDQSIRRPADTKPSDRRANSDPTCSPIEPRQQARPDRSRWAWSRGRADGRPVLRREPACPIGRNRDRIVVVIR